MGFGGPPAERLVIENYRFRSSRNSVTFSDVRRSRFDPTSRASPGLRPQASNSLKLSLLLLLLPVTAARAVDREFVYIEMRNPSPPEKKLKGEDEEEECGGYYYSYYNY